MNIFGFEIPTILVILGFVAIACLLAEYLMFIRNKKDNEWGFPNL